MVTESITNLAKAIKERKIEKAEELVDEIIEEKGGGGLEKLEESLDIDTELLKEIQMHGYSTIGELANASLDKLVKISELRDGNAKEVLNSAKKHVRKRFTELPGVGEDTAKEILNHGYVSFRGLAKASVEELSKIPGIGKKGAEKIQKYVKNKTEGGLENLPGVGEESAEEMRNRGFTAMGAIKEAPVGELTNIPNIGEKGAKEIIEYAKENPEDRIEDLPGVGKKSAEEIRNYGYTALGRVAESSVEELSEIPNIGKKGAKKILDYARGKVGGKIEDLPNVDEETAKEMRKHGYSYIKNVAKSSVEELVKIPGLKEGKAKKVTDAAEEIIQAGGGDVRGYIHALKGMVSGLETDHELTLSHKIAKGKYSEEELKEIKERMKKRASHQFRPPGERKFNKAWADILTAILELEEDEEK